MNTIAALKAAEENKPKRPGPAVKRPTPKAPDTPPINPFDPDQRK
jgi:hypothetical protein